MSVKAVGQASALHRTDSGTAAPGGSGQQQSTAQLSVASWVPPLSGGTAQGSLLKSLVTEGLCNRDPNQQIPLGPHVAEVPTKAEIQKAVGARLACAMHEDWRAAIGQHSKTDGAAKSARPMTTTEFNRRWAAVCDIIEGRCVPRPDRINSHRAES